MPMSHPAPAASEPLANMDTEPTAMNQQAFQTLSSATAPNTRCSSPVFRAEDDHMSDGGEYPANKPLFLNFTSDLAPFNSSKRQKTRKNNVYRVSGINILNRNSVDSKTAMERLQKRRENHNFVERRRRDNINQTITELAAAIPNTQRDGHKLHKGNVLRMAVEHIRDLQAENTQLRQQLGLASPRYPFGHAGGGTSTPSSSGQMSPLGGESSGMLSDATHSPSHAAATAEGANSSATAVSSTKPSPAPSVTPNSSRRPSINHYHNLTPPYIGSSRPSMALSGGPVTAPIMGGSTASSTPVTPVFRPTQMDALPHLNRYYAPPPFHALPHTTLPPSMPENLEYRLRENPNVVSTPLPSISNTPIPSVPNSPGISPNRPIEELVLPSLQESARGLHGGHSPGQGARFSGIGPPPGPQLPPLNSAFPTSSSLATTTATTSAVGATAATHGLRTLHPSAATGAVSSPYTMHTLPRTTGSSGAAYTAATASYPTSPSAYAISQPPSNPQSPHRG